MKSSALVCCLLVQLICLSAYCQDSLQATGIIEDVLTNNEISLRNKLASKADPNETDKNKNTALMLAVAIGRPGIIMALVDAGADINRRNSSGTTALMFAALYPKGDAADMQEDNISTLRFLLDKSADVNLKSNDGRTALMRAAAAGNSRAVSLLLAHGATINDKDQKHKSAMSYAREAGHADVVKLLLKAGAK